MKDSLFICPKCMLTNILEEGNKYICELCNEYRTKVKQNLERQKMNCSKYLCAHCNKIFRNKILLKAHTKDIQKLENTNLLLDFIKNDEKASLEAKISKMDIEDHNDKREKVGEAEGKRQKK